MSGLRRWLVVGSWSAVAMGACGKSPAPPAPATVAETREAVVATTAGPVAPADASAVEAPDAGAYAAPDVSAASPAGDDAAYAAPEDVAAPGPATLFRLAPPAKVDPADRSQTLGAWIGALDVTPLVSADGSTIAYADVRNDGGRGNPNLTIEVLDTASDKVLRELVILTANEVDDDDPDAKLDDATYTKQLVARIEHRVGAALGELKGTTWHPLVAMTAPPQREDSDRVVGPYTATYEGQPLAVSFSEPALTVTLGGKRVDAASGARPTWSASRYPACPKGVEPPGPGGCGCENPATFSEAWVDSTTKVVFLRIAYNGTDTCWEPDATEHALRF